MKPQLFDYELQEGQRLLDAFDKASVHIHTALWLYSDESESWHLILGTPLYDESPLVTYSALLDVFSNVLPELRIEWTSLKAVGLNDEVILGLTYTENNYKHVFISEHICGGYYSYVDEQQVTRHVHVDEAFIYFVNRKVI